MDLDSARGCLVGLACGDALGRPVEFTQGRVDADGNQLTTMLGYGTHDQPAGTVTDDTEMMLCIAQSLTQSSKFDPEDIASRFVQWYLTGPFDIGMMTADAVRKIRQGRNWDEAGKEVWETRNEGQNAGNGSVMRCAPIALAYRDRSESLITASRQSSKITHYDPRCQYGCAILNLTLAKILDGDQNPLESALKHIECSAPPELLNALKPIPHSLQPTELDSNGYVVDTLQTALYYGLASQTVEEAVVAAVNMGGDTDTVGAITGAIAGTRYGATEIPEKWTHRLQGTNRTELTSLADEIISTSLPAPD